MKYDNCKVTSFADDVMHGNLIQGPYVRALAKRHLDDLKNAHERGWKFDLVKAQNALSFFPNVLKLTGEDQGEPFNLFRWQEFFIGSIFGWVDVETGNRRFLNAYAETSKGSGKTPLAAGIGLYMMLFDVPKAEVYICAANRDQGLITFNDIIGMKEQSEYLTRKHGLRVMGGERKESLIDKNGNILKVLAYQKDGSGTSGYRPNCAIIDELHEHRNREMLRSLRKGFKRKKQPLCVIFTNSGFDKLSVCYEERLKAINASMAEEKYDRYFGFVCANDEGDDPIKNEKCWPKTNPSLKPIYRNDPKNDTSIPTYEYLRNEVNDALETPAAMSALLRYNFCTWTEGYSSWLSRGLWDDACTFGKDLVIEDYDGNTCYGGLDLALRRCMTSNVLVFPSLHEDFKYDIFANFWMAGDNILESERRDHREGLYTAWRNQGYLRALSGKTIDHHDVAVQLKDLDNKYKVSGIAFDRRYVDTIMMEFRRMDNPPEFPLVEHPQGFTAGYKVDKTDKEAHQLYMPTSIKRTEILLRQRKIRVAPNPILTSHIASSVAIPNQLLKKDSLADQAEEIRLAPSSPGEFNDGAIALVQAVGLAEIGTDFANEVMFDMW